MLCRSLSTPQDTPGDADIGSYTSSNGSSDTAVTGPTKQFSTGHVALQVSLTVRPTVRQRFSVTRHQYVISTTNMYCMTYHSHCCLVYQQVEALKLAISRADGLCAREELIAEAKERYFDNG
jgi:hypothetical protein